MIQEYAVDPEIFADPVECERWIERFDVERGRHIAGFPKWEKWKARVNLAMEASGIRPLARKSVIEKYLPCLRTSGVFLDPRLVDFDHERNWIQNAIDEHSREPFTGIIAKSSEERCSGLHLAEEFNPHTHFEDTSGDAVPRSAKEMALAIRRVLRNASVVKFVDPYWASDDRFTRPLGAFLAEALKGVRIKTLELHVSREWKNAPPTSDFERACRTSLSPLLPSGYEIVVYRWKTFHDGDAFHARYVLTNFCGVRFDHGLDEGELGETTDVELMRPRVYKRRYQQYQGNSSSFDLSDKVIVTGCA